METLARPQFASPDTEPELNLLLAWDVADDHRRWKKAAIGSAIWHVFLLIVVLLMPGDSVKVYPRAPVITVTHLITPSDITQTAPNKGKLSKELSLEAIPPQPTPRTSAKTPAPPAPVKQTPKAAPVPAPPQVAKAEPKPVVVEPPTVDLPKIEPPKIQLEAPPVDSNARANGPTPSPQPPKLAMENVAPPPSPSRGSPAGRPAGSGGLLLPNPSVDAAIHELSSNGGAPTGRQIVSDPGSDARNFGLNLPPSAGRPQSNLELRSDPMGVDFRPYMQQVLAAVRRNWFAVYPEAARLGQRGEVGLEFAIVKQGTVTKVIFGTESGAKALDQAAVAAISASNPLPPLPIAFKGERIVLRMTFQYNMPR
jgi:TonB family protein